MLYVLNPDVESFDAYVRNHPQHSIYQSTGWAGVKREWDCLRIIAKIDDKIVGAAQILIRRFPLGKALFYIPRGPLWDIDKPEVKEGLMAKIVEEGKKQGAFLIKFDPNRIVSIKNQKDEVLFSDQPLNDYLSMYPGVIHLGFKTDMAAYAQPRFNAVVSSENELIEQCSSSTKRNIKIALRKNVVVRHSGKEDLDTLARVIGLTEQRKHVALRNRGYFQRFFEAFPSEAHIFIASIDLEGQLKKVMEELVEIMLVRENTDLASKSGMQQTDKLNALEKEQLFLQKQIEKDGNNVDVSGFLVLIYEDTCEFLYSGSDSEYSKYYAPYLMWMRIMEYAKEQGCTKLNFGGMQGTLDDGLWEFKRSFGAMVVEYIGEFDLPVSKFWYTVFQNGIPIAKKIYHRSMKLIKRPNTTK